MATQMEEDATTVLRFIIDRQEEIRPQFELLGDEPPCAATGQQIQDGTGLPPGRINDAVALLENSGYAETLRHMGTAPFDFGEVEINALGRYQLQRAEAESPEAPSTTVSRLPYPVGSPYGFREEDYEFIENELRQSDRVKVVFGHQWESSHYSTGDLRANLQGVFEAAVARYNGEPGHEKVHLLFVPLSAGYGEHLFNEIVRDIVSADIAVFDTSDLNPNVMIEMGVALTWGVRVLPVKAEDTPVPPSDISGQTWASYLESGTRWIDTDHETKVLGMVRRAMRRKSG
jgi:hypothetical protein